MKLESSSKRGRWEYGLWRLQSENAFVMKWREGSEKEEAEAEARQGIEGEERERENESRREKKLERKKDHSYWRFTIQQKEIERKKKKTSNDVVHVELFLPRL